MSPHSMARIVLAAAVLPLFVDLASAGAPCGVVPVEKALIVLGAKDPIPRSAVVTLDGDHLRIAYNDEKTSFLVTYRLEQPEFFYRPGELQ